MRLVGKDIASDVEGLELESRAGQIGQCRQWLATAAAFFLYETAETGPAICYVFQRNTASLLKEIVKFCAIDRLCSGLIWFSYYTFLKFYFLIPEEDSRHIVS